MKRIAIPAGLFFNEADNSFIENEPIIIEIEHSLVAVSKWESKWHTSFFDDTKKTTEQTIDYIRCMTLTPDVDPSVYYVLPPDVLKEIGDYIEDPMSAIDWSKKKNNGNTRTYGRPSSETMTSELIYYWMFSYQIPKECEHWHLNRLLSLIHLFNLKNTPNKKMSQKALMSRNASLNAARRKALNTTG